MRAAGDALGRGALLAAALVAGACGGAGAGRAAAGGEGPDGGDRLPDVDDAAAALDGGSPTEAAVDGAPAALDGGLALADGFETAAVGGPPDPALWTVESPDCSGSGTLAVDDSQAHSGLHSVRVDGGGGYCDHVFFGNADAIARLGGQVYARFFVRLGAPLGQGHVTFLAMKDQADDGGDLRMGGQDAVLVYNRESDDATLPVLSPAGVAESTAPPASEWICVELHVDEAAGTIDTWVNGEAIAGLTEDGTPVADVSTQWLSQPWTPSLADLRFGWESYAGQAMTLWFDDVALAAGRIGCGG